MSIGNSVEELPADPDFEFRPLPSSGRKDVTDVRRLLGWGLGVNLSDPSQKARKDDGD
jgi:hypothetical protein